MELNRYIDHTNLKAFTTVEDIIKLCEEAKKYHFAAVCVNPYYVKLASNILKNTDVKVCTVIGFPLGANTLETKVFETLNALENGAEEIDMVINIGALKCGMVVYVEEEIRTINNIVKEKNKVLKVIIEICYLTDEEIELMSGICHDLGVDFIKTSTGFGPSGADPEKIKYMTLYEGLEVKAAGGIKTKEEAEMYLKLGVQRIGTSNGVTIVGDDKK